MGFLDYFKTKEKIELSVDSAKQEYFDLPKKSFVFKINTQSDFRVNESLGGYDSAVESARSYDYPNRYELLKYYERARFIDGHLNNLYNLRINKILGLSYSLTSNGKETNRLIDISRSTWLRNIMSYIMEAIFYGNSLIQIDVLDSSDVSVQLVPRVGVVPEFRLIKAEPMSVQGTESYDKYIGTHLLDVNNNYNSRDLGLFRTLARLQLLKEQASLNWGEFIETYGQPMASVTSDSTNVNDRQAMGKFLREMGRRKYIIKDSQTSIDFIDAAKSTSSSMFMDFIKFINDEMSEVVLTGSMLTSDGSSRSQAEVHERGSLLLTKSDMKFVSTIINSQLIPILQAKNIIPRGNIVFAFDDIEILTIDEKLRVDAFLIENYNKAPEYFQSRYGIVMDIKEEAPVVEEPTPPTE